MLAELNRKFGQGDAAKFVAGYGGLPRIDVNTAACTGSVYLHGAHVTHWQKRGESPVLWMSEKSWFEDAKPIRGGVPICFPWFGPNANNATLPAHGFVRLKSWSVQSVTRQGDDVTIALETKSDEQTLAVWPVRFTLVHRITFGATLTMSLELTNLGGDTLTCEEALHTYFVVGDIKQTRVAGLNGVTFIDKMDNKARKPQQGEITFTGETDRVYINTCGASEIIDPALRRKIIISKENSHATVVWNPWINKSKAMPDFGDDEWTGMVCIETCNAADNALSLAAGATHIMRAVIATASL